MHPHLTPRDIERFWSFVTKTDGCWLFTGTPSQRYGQFVAGRRQWSAHRLAYELAYGPIPNGLQVCHHCDVTRCCRPEHLFVGTRRDNAQDAVAKGRYEGGDAHWSRRMPECRARGTRNGTYSKPQSRAVGDRNGQRTHPERTVRGEAHYAARLSAEQVRAIRERYATGGIYQRELAAEYGVDQTMISHIVHGKAWKHVT